MPTALFLSPHLDDVAFSCGGLLAGLGDRGWRTVMVTAFTATILPAAGFALACQLDKGLPPEADYMALRRAEDRTAAALLGVADLRWLGLPEAPHRGYDDAPELFGALRPGDDVWRLLAARVAALVAELAPDLMLAPQGLGGHVDHRQLIRAVQEAGGSAPIAWYRDTPYAIRNADARPFAPAGPETTVPIAATLERKIASACAYASQIGFQFGGPVAAASALGEFALHEGKGIPAERFSGNFPPAALQP